MRDRIGWLLLPDMSWLRATVRWKTLLIAAILGAAAVVAFIAVGAVPIAANEPDSWLTYKVLHTTFRRSVAESARTLIAPDDLNSEGRIRLGARQFDMVCANCHGGPGMGQSTVALSMSPQPQNLPKVVDQYTDEELFVIVQNGVKFSAMPSWPVIRPEEVWSMVAFLRKLPKMDATTYRAMTAAVTPAAQTPTIPQGEDITLRPADLQRALPQADEYLNAAPAIGFGYRTLTTNPVAVCSGCHGLEGDGAATGGEAPNLTVLDSDYIQASLEAYSRGQRKSGFMQEIATQLSSSQINALANYYAGLPARTLAASVAQKPDAGKLGETIAMSGIPSRVIAACANCHESAGSKLSGAPHIAGQSEIYLRRQLTAFKNGRRGSVRPWSPMYSEAHDLRESEIASLAAYYSGLKPAKAGGAQMAAAWPTGDAAKGEPIFRTVCTKCHLNGGRGDNEGSFPDLRLQAAPYIVHNLHAFRSRVRDNVKMNEVAADLSDTDILNVAAFLNSLPPEPAVARSTKPASDATKAIAERGIGNRGVPACLTCHGAEGVAALPLVARLNGQSAPYLNARLDLFASESNENFSTLNPMPAIAKKLTAQERSDLAAYFSSLSPLGKSSTN